MTKETSTTAALNARIASASPETTVFSDGSTFDYENGYQSNGAPIATRDRKDIPKIVKTGVVMTSVRWVIALMTLIVLGIVSFLAVMVTSLVQAHENYETIVKTINDSGQVEVVDGDIMKKLDSGTILLSYSDEVTKCDISIATKTDVVFTDTVDNHTMEADTSKVETPMAYVFCSPGDVASISIPVPHDPDNIFYVAPAKETKH
jgi:hypothetical protein